MNSISRFVHIQKKYYDIVKQELKNKKKQTHWMWFMFPQLKELGSSYMSKYYGIEGEQEALEYWNNRYLRRNMKKLGNILLKYDENTDIEDVFDSVDAMKLKSSMTLFYITTKEELFNKILKKFYNSCFDEKTVVLLNRGK